jgi:hypothetical protein
VGLLLLLQLLLVLVEVTDCSFAAAAGVCGFSQASRAGTSAVTAVLGQHQQQWRSCNQQDSAVRHLRALRILYRQCVLQLQQHNHAGMHGIAYRKA